MASFNQIRLQRANPQTFNKALGQALRHFRLQAMPKHSQASLAASIGLSRSTYANLEAGTASISTQYYFRVLVTLDIDSEEFLKVMLIKVLGRADS